LKLLIADKLPSAHVDLLRGIVEVEYAPDLTAESLTKRIPGIRILVVRGTRVDAATIERDSELELIVRAGAGTENIDLETASARGVYVTNCPDKNSAAVAELTLGLLLAVDRRIPAQTEALMKNVWDKEKYSKADGLKGKIFGVVGVGAVGSNKTSQRLRHVRNCLVTFTDRGRCSRIGRSPRL
jgi:D-3-phosphoglycerate dehydrogenase